MKDCYKHKISNSVATELINEFKQINNHLQLWNENKKGLVFLNDLSKGGKVYLTEVELIKNQL
jgi:hypothetical protein